MKAISASIVVLSGAILLSVGSTINHDQTQLFICGVGLVIGAIGLSVWAVRLGREP